MDEVLVCLLCGVIEIKIVEDDGRPWVYSLVFQKIIDDGGSKYRFPASGNAMQPKGRVSGLEPIFIYGALDEPISRMLVS